MEGPSGEHQAAPVISFTFSTSSPVYKKSEGAAFKVIMSAVLRNTSRPITLLARENIFDVKAIFYTTGIIFIDTATKEIMQNHTRILCFGRPIALKFGNERLFVTLYPDIPVTWEFPAPDVADLEPTVSAHLRYHVLHHPMYNLVAGNRYRIGISRDDRNSQDTLWWRWGPKLQVMLGGWIKGLSVGPDTKGEGNLKIEVAETAEFVAEE